MNVYEKPEQPEKVPEVPIISVYQPIAPTTNRLKPSIKPAKNSTADINTYYFITKPPSSITKPAEAQTTPESNTDQWEAVQVS